MNHMFTKAFENSHTSILVNHSGRLIGFGRAISDNENWHGEFWEGGQHDIARLHRVNSDGQVIYDTCVKWGHMFRKYFQSAKI